MELLIPLFLAGALYGGTYAVDRRQKPSVVAGGLGGIIGTILMVVI